MIRKLIFNIVIVAFVVFVLDFAIGKVLRYFYFNETSGLHYRTTYSMEKTVADILIFGSSRASRHYVPEIFEDSLKMTFYNTGRDGNGVFYQLAVLKSVLKRYTPKVIIFDFTGSFANSQEEYDRMSSLLPYYKTHSEIREIIELKSPYERIKLISEIYPFNSLTLTILLRNMEINKKRKPDDYGYRALYDEWKEKIDSIKLVQLYVVDSNKVNALREFVNLAKETGANVFIVYSPIFQKFKMRQEIEICWEICANEKVPFWDFSRDTSFQNHQSYFHDVSHLNHNGATKFSELIATCIKQDIK